MIWITVKKTANALILNVRDDGRGFDVESVDDAYAQKGSLGLLNMKERAELCHGKLTIDSKPGKGTLVSLALPLNEPQRNARLF